MCLSENIVPTKKRIGYKLVYKVKAKKYKSYYFEVALPKIGVKTKASKSCIVGLQHERSAGLWHAWPTLKLARSHKDCFDYADGVILKVAFSGRRVIENKPDDMFPQFAGEYMTIIEEVE